MLLPRTQPSVFKKSNNFIKKIIMTVVLKKGASNQELCDLGERLFSKAKASAGCDAKKYNGTVKFTEDALLIQKRLRDEWERNIG
jgi:hypothetical protein